MRLSVADVGRVRARFFSTSQLLRAGLEPSPSPPPPAPPLPLPLLSSAHPRNNVPPSVRERVGRGLYLDARHPLGQLCGRIRAHFESGAASRDGAQPFRVFDSLSPIVTVRQNFDDLLTPADHVSRSPTDSFYVDERHLLRCHMTAHQTELLRDGHAAFLMVGDVFRRDEIDATHFPIFHQVDGVRVFSGDALRAAAGSDAASQRAYVVADLRFALTGLVRALFGPGAQSRWIEDATFPFTDPSAELEILFEGRWLEVLGCGRIRDEIVRNCALPSGAQGWAFGMGLERLAMVMYGVPDIRLFWSRDPRFLEQFASGGPVAFRPYSKYPPCYKDVTFWLPRAGFHENDFNELVREAAGDVVEAVKLLDAFTHPKSLRTSRCYRILYRSMNRNLTNAEVDELQARVRDGIVSKLGGELR